MAFDHGVKVVIPLNLVLLTLNVFVWEPMLPLWVVVVVAITLLLLSIDKYLGMFLMLILLPILLFTGFSVKQAVRRIKEKHKAVQSLPRPN